MATVDKWILVTAYTSHHRVEGEVLLRKGEQLSDKLNLTERAFELVRNGRVLTIDKGELLHEAPSVALNKERITMMVPREE